MTNPIITTFTGDYLAQYKKLYPTGKVSDPEYGAFRHGYCSAVLAKKLGSSLAESFGNMYEFFGVNSDNEHKQDFYNNRVGRDLVGNRSDLNNLTNDEIATIVKNAIDEGAFILDENDERILEIPDDYWSYDKARDWAKEVMDYLAGTANTIDDAFQDYLNALLQSENNPPPARVDPLTLDLDGDGVELISLSNSTAFFDLDVVANLDENGNFDGTYTTDGTKEQVGWVKADDGILALDKNSNGTIDNILELFGKSNKTGTEELREYDLNSDGVINSNDAVFNQLKIWQDANGNGISETEELKTLADHGITSINLNNLTTKNENNGGNLVISEGTYTKNITNSEGNIEEVTRTYNNLDLAVNQANSVAYEYTDPDGNTTGDYDLNLEALFLPFIRGYGNVDALPVAASKNETLLTQLQELRDLTPTEYNTINAKVEQILYQWTGTSDISDEAMRGSYSAKKLAVLEAMRGEAYVFNGESGDVPAFRAGLVDLAWNTLFNDIKSKLLVQSTFKDIFSHTDGEETVYATYDFVTDSLNYNGLTADELFTNITNSITSITSSESTASDSEVADRINEAYAAVTQDHFRTEITKLLNIILNSSSNNITDLTYANLSSHLASLNANELGDKIFTISDNTAEDHDSIITNRTGDDTLYGLRGDDTYVFNVGDGKDTINESAGVTETKQGNLVISFKTYNPMNISNDNDPRPELNKSLAS